VQRSAELRLQPDPARYTLPAFVEDVAERYGDRPAVRFEGTEIDYRDLAADCRRFARALAAAGVGKGTRVAVWMANRPQWIVAAYGASMVGAVVVPVNTFATSRERDYILAHSDATVLVLQRRLLKRELLSELVADHPQIATAATGAIQCEGLPSLRRVVCFDRFDDTGARASATHSQWATGGVERWEDLLARADEVTDDLIAAMAAEVTPADDGVIIYTSGTTDLPKGVVHYQRAPVIQSWRFAELMELTPDDRVWTAQPFFWSAGMAMSLGATLAAGACLVLQETFEPGAALALIESERPTTLHAWPHQEKAMAEHPDARTRDLSCVKRIEFSSPLAPVVGLQEDVWGTYGAYGLTETFTIASSLPASAPAALRAATSGRPLAGTDLRIVDPEDGRELARGERGEIAVQGLTTMRGYHKVDRTRCFDADGFFHTSDGGWFDDDGYLHWTGRLSNLIKTGGANVSPAEIEAVLADFPGLTTCAAVGVPHPTLGEAIVLCAVAAPGMVLDPDAVRTAAAGKLATYKVPKHVEVVARADVEFTGSQKLRVEGLRELMVARLAAAGVTIAGHRYARSDRRDGSGD